MWRIKERGRAGQPLVVVGAPVVTDEHDPNLRVAPESRPRDQQANAGQRNQA